MSQGKKIQILNANGKPVEKDYLEHRSFEFQGKIFPFRYIDEQAAMAGANPVLLCHAIATQNQDFNNLMLLMMKCLAEDAQNGTSTFKELSTKLNLSVVLADGSQLSIVKDLK